MDPLIGVIALVVLLLLPVAASAPGLYAAWRRRVPRAAELEMWPVMERLGVRLVETPGSEAGMARVVRRCVMCGSIPECQAWLASGASDRLHEFCPNASVFDGLPKR